MNATESSNESFDNLPPWLGLDIGGANLKASHTSGWASSHSFPMWKRHQELGVAIAHLLEDAPAFVGVAVTMTGELADCFATRAHGVAHILEQTTSILPASMLKVYGVQGQWLSVSSAARDPWAVAASNWHAFASLVAIQYPQGRSLVIDIGSTTTDITPLENGAIAIATRTDSQRLQLGALVYTGVERSHVGGISQRLPLYGKPCPVMNECFATSRDVHLWLGDLDEDSRCNDTADSGPATRDGARHRLARLVGEDGSTLADEDIDEIARAVRADQVTLIARGLSQVVREYSASEKKPKGRKASTVSEAGSLPQKTVSATTVGGEILPERIILGGHGSFLIEDALRELEWSIERIHWGQDLGPQAARCAPAYAVAKLAQRQFD